MFDVDAALRHLVEVGGSDLHLKAAAPPTIRIHGELRPIPDTEPLTSKITWETLKQIVKDPALFDEFERDGEADFSYSVEGVSRFRVNAFRQRGSTAIALRAIPFQVRTVEDLGLPTVISDLADEQRGIVLLTGTTGSGKSTTLAAMVDHINSTTRATSSRSRIRSSTCTATSSRSSASARSARTPRASAARCAASCARTPT